MISDGNITVVGLYLFLINLFTFLLYGLDKYKAVRQEWRIPERILFGRCLWCTFCDEDFPT